MDAKVVARYYRVSPQPNSSDFHDLLLQQVKLERTVREQNLAGETIVRVERCVSDGVFVDGEFCRIQKTNLPPAAGPTGLTPIKLEAGHGIGHMVAFRLHLPTRVLLLQSNSLSVNEKRIAEYVMALNAAAVFAMVPVLTQDAWDRFTKKPVRAMQLSFSSPSNLEALDALGVPAAKGAKALAEAYKGTSVEITVGVGKKRKSFLHSKVVKTTIEAVVALSGGVSKAKVQTASAEDAADEERVINFLKEHMKARKTLDLPEGDPEGNYLIRQAFLKHEMDGKIAHLTKFYGPKADGSAN